MHLPPRSGNLPVLEYHFLPIIFFLKRLFCIEFCNERHCYVSKVSTKYNNKMLRILWWVLSHYKEGISHHFQNFSQNLNVGGQNQCRWMVSRKISLFGKMQTRAYNIHGRGWKSMEKVWIIMENHGNSWKRNAFPWKASFPWTNVHGQNTKMTGKLWNLSMGLMEFVHGRTI